MLYLKNRNKCLLLLLLLLLIAGLMNKMREKLLIFYQLNYLCALL